MDILHYVLNKVWCENKKYNEKGRKISKWLRLRLEQGEEENQYPEIDFEDN